jgi:hypothetical protein
MALVRRTATGSELGLTRLIRADRIMVDGWRPIDLTQQGHPQVTQITDVAWLDASELLVIGSPSKGATQVPVRVHRRRIADHLRGRTGERLGRPRGDRTDADPIGGRRRR